MAQGEIIGRAVGTRHILHPPTPVSSDGGGGLGGPVVILAPMKSFFFVFRIALAWGAGALFVLLMFAGMFGERRATTATPFAFLLIGIVIVRTISHVPRVRLIADEPDTAPLASRHRRRIEIPFPAADAFDMVDAAIRDLPYVDMVESTRDSLQIFARVKRMDPYLSSKQGRRHATGAAGA